ncbi:oxidoreductase [Pseudomonas stutzeri]|uniref:Gfo/Idh/MocA family oxidoreductase n=1 Tax=Stutzerimonas stutzeri TaxID=316 RepID=UPI00210DF1FE|nr:Gfo/Idh/MocA family oxidoreductase [Stutzerimonas stutzeri]MCQ4298131.1 oxidoreductase [Stutzerimonas stutzeri]
MKVLIIGLGYAGLRWQHALEHVGRTCRIAMSIAYLDRRERPSTLERIGTIDEALEAFGPDLVVVSVNDVSHAAVLRQLGGYRGFVICEKPLATPADDLGPIDSALASLDGFSLNLVERYSSASQTLREWVARHRWRLVRAHFNWGKDRINDYRPTCGVTSEVIHALDLVSWICPTEGEWSADEVIGVRSDFSISGPAVLDTVMVGATLGEVPVTGYSSFVNVVRQRTVDWSFVDDQAHVIHARLTFDTPCWDHDHLRIWMRDSDGTQLTLHETSEAPSEPGLKTLHKLSHLCRDAVLWVARRREPDLPFADLRTAIKLQRLLNTLETRAKAAAVPARYIRSQNRVLLGEDSDLESLG